MQTFLQILFAICLVVVFFVIGFAIYNYEFLKSLKSDSNTLREVVPIFTGIKDLSNTSEEVYDATDKGKPSYRKIGASYNQKGGIEFSYSFWLFLNDLGSVYSDCNPTNTAIQPDEGIKSTNIAKQTILFLKGTDALSTYNNVCNKPKTDYMVKCPLVKLENCGRNITVEFNTLKTKSDNSEYIEGIKQGSRNVCTDSTTVWSQGNSHKLTLGNINRTEFNNKWILMTVVLQDTFPSDPLPYRNKVRCRVYVNNLIELDSYVDGNLVPTKDNFSTIKVNEGNLYVFPQPSVTSGGNSLTTPRPDAVKKVMMADLTYYNHAVDQTVVDALFAAGPSKKNAPSVGASTDYSDILTVAQPSSSKMTN